MSDSENLHERDAKDQKVFEGEDIVFDCPLCGKNLVIQKIAIGHKVECPGCHQKIEVPAPHHVVTLDEAPETQKIKAMPEQQRELLSVEASIRESKHQREEAGNFFKHHASELNRLQVRLERNDPTLDDSAKKAFEKHQAEAHRCKGLMEKLDVRLKELEAKRKTLSETK